MVKAADCPCRHCGFAPKWCRCEEKEIAGHTIVINPYIQEDTVEFRDPVNGYVKAIVTTHHLTKLCDICSERISTELTGKCLSCGADYIEGILDGRSVKNYELLMKKGRESSE